MRGYRAPYGEFYALGLPDAEIAVRCGVARSSVAQWRRYHNLPSHGYTIKTGDFARLYADGLADIEIAARCGCGRSNVCQWRRRHGLPSHGIKGRTPGAIVFREGYPALYALGLLDEEIARRGGGSVHNVRNWRWRNRLPSHWRPECQPQPALAAWREPTWAALMRFAAHIGEGVREEFASLAFVEILEGRATLAEITTPGAISQRLIGLAFESECGSRYGPRSLDECDEFGRELHERLADPGALEAFEQIEFMEIAA